MRRRFARKGPKYKRFVYDSSGRRVEYFRYQGSSCNTSTKNEGRCSDVPLVVPDNNQVDDLGNVASGSNRKYSQKRKQLSDSWKAVREKLLAVRTEELSPSTFYCCRCGQQTDEIIRCKDCSHLAYYCQPCCDEIHATVLFHAPSIWKGIMFIPYTTRKTPVLERHHHDCSTSYLRDLCIVDVKGVQHKAKLKFCLCEEECITTLRYGLWPATPVKPRIAFQIELLELSTALQLEGALSTKSFCDGLKYIRRFQIDDVQEVKNLYRVLVGDCCNEYRYHRTIFEQGTHLGLEPVCCPACTKNSEFQCKCVCVDANFGLVHKRGSGMGQGLEGVRHKDSFFLDQNYVDSFVDSYKNPKLNKDCSSFQAGNVLRSKIKNDKLDITGVFGSVCKHDFPLKFCNLRHGERLAYAVYFMEKIQFGNPFEKTIFMYDIACLLYKHLKLNGKNDLLLGYTFAVPVFHSFAHNIQCQLQFAQRNVEGTGLADGEGTERLWSYLRTMSRITKEMSLDNRHDCLVDSLHHYATKLQLTLAERIVGRHKKAVALKDSSMEYFKKLEEGGVIGSMDDIRKLNEERKCSSTYQNVAGNTNFSDEEAYCWLLKQSMDIREKLTGPGYSDSQLALNFDLESVEKKLRKKEKKLKISQRWLLTDPGTIQSLQSYVRKKESGITQELKGLAVERKSLLNAMKKYADGQAIALRIGKQLQIVNSKVHTKLVEYNSFGNQRTFIDVSSPESEFFGTTVSASLSSEQLTSLEQYSIYARAVEEVKNSKEDMQNMVEYFQIQGQTLKTSILELQHGHEADSNQPIQPNLFYLMLKKMSNECFLSDLSKALSPYIDSVDYDSIATDYVFQCMGVTEFLPAISSTDLQESLALIQEFEDDNKDDDLSSDDEDEC